MADVVAGFFAPAIQFLSLARDRLTDLAAVSRVGIDLGLYIAPARALGPGFQLAVQTMIGGAILAVVVLAGRGALNLYLRFKAGVKWW